MTFRYKNSSIMTQVGFGAVFFLFSLIFGDWLIAIIGGFVAIIIFRDCIKLKHTSYEIFKDHIELRVKGELVKSLKWNQLEYVTKTRKNVRWVVIGHMKEQIALKPSIEGFDTLVQEVLKHIKDNKEVYVHDKILALKK